MAYYQHLKVFARLTVISLLSVVAAYGQNNDRYAGLHFDFQPRGKDSLPIGRHFSPRVLDSLLKMAKPDYIQIDAKGSWGYSSYPTEVGNRAVNIQGDILKIAREVTAKNKVDLYVHYSNLIDEFQVAKHPDWANIKSNGSKDWLLSYKSAYVDSLLIPQLKELALKYKINGVWLDGDAYAASLDYSPAFQQKFTKNYGLPVPKNKTDASYISWLEFNRAEYLRFFETYVNTMHKAAPGFKIINDWAYSSYMPQSANINVDYLSGDIRGREPYQAAFEARHFATQNKDWDLMSWAIMVKSDNSSYYKSAAQLSQEAAIALAFGGGFETYFFQNRDGTLQQQLFKTMADIVSFCKERKTYCFRGSAVPQIGLFYSANSWKDSSFNNFLFYSNGTNALREIMRVLIDNQMAVDVLMERQLQAKLSTYPLVIVPEWNNLGKDVIKQLLQYVNNGGNLIVAGSKAVKPFISYAGVSSVNTLNGAYKLSYSNNSAAVTTGFQQVTVPDNKGIEQVGSAIFKESKPAYPLATINKYGKGKLALVYFDINKLISENNIQPVKEFYEGITSKLFTSPIVKVIDAPNIQQVVAEKDGHLFIHLINMSGKEVAYKTIPPVSAFKIQVQFKQKPVSVLLQPQHTTPEYTYNNGLINIAIPSTDIYTIVQIN